MEQILEETFAEITHLPPEVLSLVADGDELLDSDFNVITYINTMFPTEQSLAGLNDKISEIESSITTIDDEVRGLIKWKGGQDGVEALKRAQASIEALMAKIMDMKGRAEQSEVAVRDMTRDIRQLDTAKRNLTAAITTLNHLNMLVSGVDTMQTLTKKRQYGDAANLLQGVANVVEHFDNYQSIPQIATLAHQVRDIKRELGDQISLEFRESFSGGSLNAKQMSEACLVLDVLEPHIKHNLLQWFVSLQLKEYSVLFDENEDLAWLDKVDKRYAWLKKHLIQFEERYGSIFPAQWDLSQRIALSFCHQTRTDLAKVMGKRRHEIDVKLLLGAIQKTCQFENLLFLRFGGHLIEDDPSDASNPFLNTTDEDEKNPFLTQSARKSSEVPKIERKVIPNQFNRIITQSFDPFLYIYIESQDKNLAELIEKFVSELRTNGFPTPQAPDASAVVLSNCADLFVFYKKCLVQCTQLSCGEPLLNLGHVFSKRLRDYTTKILQANLPKISSASASTLTSVSNLTRELRDLNTSNLIQNFQSLLKEGESVRFSRHELYRICSILTTSEYCVETTQQLEEKLKEKLAQPLSPSLTMDGEKNLFLEVIEMCLSLLVHDLDSACEPALGSMTKTSWQNIEAVGDQSSHVNSIISQWKITVPTLRDFLANSRKYFVLFCQQFAKLFILKYVSTLYKCKNVSKAGAQQLLLDSQSLKSSLLDLPSIALTVKRKPPDKYSKLIVREMGRIELILKLVMSPIEETNAFVDHLLKLLPDCDLSEFVKILEMKGVRRSEQIPMVEYFKSKNSGGGTGGGGGVSTSFEFDAGESNVESSRIKKLERLIKKRL